MSSLWRQKRPEALCSNTPTGAETGGARASPLGGPGFKAPTRSRRPAPLQKAFRVPRASFREPRRKAQKTRFGRKTRLMLEAVFTSRARVFAPPRLRAPSIFKGLGREKRMRQGASALR